MLATGHQAQIDHKRRLATERIRRFGLTCSIRRPSKTLSDDGYPLDSETVVANGVPCMMANIDDAAERVERVVAGQVQSQDVSALLVPWDTDVRAEDRVQLADGTRYEVQQGNGDQPGRIWIRLRTTQLNPGGAA